MYEQQSIYGEQDPRIEFERWRERVAEPIHQRFIKVEQVTATMLEALQVLDGTRNTKSLPKSAVLFEDMRFLAKLPSVPKAKKATSAPISLDQYNRLVDDVALLYECLGSLASVISRKGV